MVSRCEVVDIIEDICVNDFICNISVEMVVGWCRVIVWGRGGGLELDRLMMREGFSLVSWLVSGVVCGVWGEYDWWWWLGKSVRGV